MNPQPTATTRRATASLHAWAEAMLARLEQNPVQAFERGVGYSASFDAYHAGIKSILFGWFNRDYSSPFEPDIRKPLQWGEWKLTLRVDPGRRPAYGHFGPFDTGRPKRLLIEGICLGGRTTHCVEWDTVDEIMTELLSSMAVIFDQAWFLFGTAWVPVGLYRPTITAATLKPGTDSALDEARC